MTTQDKRSEQSFYDALFKKRKTFNQFQRGIYERMAAAARQATNGTAALEVGCGAGDQAVCLVEAGFSVIASDLSREAVKVARATTTEAGHTISLLNSDAEHIPVADASIDACVCGLLLHHFSQFDRVAADIQRVLRPGGVVVAIDANAHNPPTWLFLNVVHRMRGLPGLTPNQRALRRGEIERVFGEHGFTDFEFASVTSELRRDWLGKSLGASLNYHTRALLLAGSRMVLPQIAQGNMLLSVFRKPAASEQADTREPQLA
jgi:ubiquinone/menaquinone biosynthesis C-methylase UbiE